VESLPLERLGEAAVADAQLGPGAAGGEDDATVRTCRASILIVLVV
jgi:hypothetical protein